MNMGQEQKQKMMQLFVKKVCNMNQRELENTTLSDVESDWGDTVGKMRIVYVDENKYGFFCMLVQSEEGQHLRVWNMECIRDGDCLLEADISENGLVTIDRKNLSIPYKYLKAAVCKVVKSLKTSDTSLSLNT